jgi:hypothetical protein
MAPSDTDSVSSWVTCGKKTPRSEVVFLCQVLILYIDFMIDFIETNVEFILEFLHVPFPLDRESFVEQLSGIPVT